MKWLIGLLIVIFLALQYKLWISDSSVWRVWQLKQDTEIQKRKNLAAKKSNAALEAEVKDLKHGKRALEERARSELGMIEEGETLYQVVERDKKR